jgi:hypothetical protein
LNVSDVGVAVSVLVEIGFTISVKTCVAFVPTPFDAANVIENVPLVVGVPLSTPVVALNVTPPGSVPFSLSVGIGVPVAVIMNVPTVPTVKAALFGLVIVGATFDEAGFTVSVKFCVALVPTPLDAVNVIEDVPLAVGVPLNTPLVMLNVTPVGGVTALNVGAGNPVAATVNVPATPTVRDVLFELVIAGAWFTVSVKFCVGLVPPAFVAVKAIGYDPPVPAPGVPLSAPVVVLNVTPDGSLPVSANDVGVPVAATWKLPTVPTVKVVLVPLLIVGAVAVAAAGPSGDIAV